jgi:hypothetical protein
MDPITTAIVAALSAGAISGLTDTTKTAIIDGYNKLKTLVTKKCGAKSDVVQAIAQLEAKPESVNRKGMLQEEIAAVKMMQDDEILAAAKYLLTLVHPQQTGLGKVTIHQDHAIIQGQNIGDHQQVTQNFGNPPKAER